MTNRELHPGTLVTLDRNVKIAFGPQRFRYRAAVLIRAEAGHWWVACEHTPKLELCSWQATVCRDQGAQIRHRVWMRSVVPYGIWTCADRREVLFDRSYRPLYERSPKSDGCACRADPDERVPFVKQSWFYKDWDAPWRDRASRRRCAEILAEWVLP